MLIEVNTFLLLLIGQHWLSVHGKNSMTLFQNFDFRKLLCNRFLFQYDNFNFFSCYSNTKLFRGLANFKQCFFNGIYDTHISKCLVDNEIHWNLKCWFFFPPPPVFVGWLCYSVVVLELGVNALYLLFRSATEKQTLTFCFRELDSYFSKEAAVLPCTLHCWVLNNEEFHMHFCTRLYFLAVKSHVTPWSYLQLVWYYLEVVECLENWQQIHLLHFEVKNCIFIET